jgi:hypothetical protein
VRRPHLRAKACKLAGGPIVCHRLDFSPSSLGRSP